MKIIHVVPNGVAAEIREKVSRMRSSARDLSDAGYSDPAKVLEQEADREESRLKRFAESISAA